MSEQDLRDCMKQAVWDEPPLNFDPDSLMARAEQLTKRRRALMSVGVATALIIATFATLPAFLTAGRNKVDSATGVSVTNAAPSPSNFPWPPNNAVRRNHKFEEDQPYLIGMWTDIISPGLQRQGVDPASIGTWSPTFQETGYERDNSVFDVLVGSVTYAGPSGPALLETTIAGVGAWGPSPDEMCKKLASNGTCNVAAGPDGSAVVTVERGGRSGNGTFYAIERSAYNYRLDGSVVAMTSRAPFTDSTSLETDQIPLNLDQLTELATIRAIALQR